MGAVLSSPKMNGTCTICRTNHPVVVKEGTSGLLVMAPHTDGQNVFCDGSDKEPECTTKELSYQPCDHDHMATL